MRQGDDTLSRDNVFQGNILAIVLTIQSVLNVRKGITPRYLWFGAGNLDYEGLKRLSIV